MKAVLDHVGIAVSDIKASLEFFRDALASGGAVVVIDLTDGRAIGSSYQSQGLALSKHFKKFRSG